ncbi:DUF2384 domain-containing protein [Rudanella paleaurantiibacter]|uniref:DUF2384 domain-containing protein n=1 Tax=Rudanella paleaurantiibacter TaxID=2614655 RepID=A0A7J5TY35_9BACT|nr:antitoxin Xre/MbcA/ParS toxin-binding domain-containing protein [Rudanella paleaurantiibacter]KAB7729975.1 DUF2384 domain-containing protein [Rudanella paleaurantiibacter]
MTHATAQALPVSYPPFMMIARSRQGVPRVEVDQVAELVGLTDKEMAPILNMSERNMHRLKDEDRLARDSSERLLLLTNLLRHALDVFDGDAETVASWLRTPIRELAQQAPIQLLDTTTGFGLVDDVLGRIEHGIVG